jgi:DNA polymerase-3 subunit gamma/tau
MILNDLADLTHFVTRLKVSPATPRDPARTEIEDLKGRAFAAALSMAALSRAWQMLLKGIAETNAAEDGLAAAEMALIRLAFAAGAAASIDLADLALDPARPLAAGQQAAAAAPPPSAPPVPAAQAAEAAIRPAAPPTRADAPPVAAATPPAGGPEPATFRDIVEEAGRRRDIRLKGELERFARPVRVDAPAGVVEFALEPGAPKSLHLDLARRLEEWTGRRWMVMLSSQAGEAPLAAAARDRREGLMREAREHPAVRDVLARFPGAEIVDVKDAAASPELPAEAAFNDDSGND